MNYNSEQVCSSVRSQHQSVEGISEIVSAIDDYSNSTSGHYATKNILLYSGEDDRKTFKRGAAKYVRKNVYGGIGGMLVWILIKPYVMKIIESFIDSMIMSYGEAH